MSTNDPLNISLSLPQHLTPSRGHQSRGWEDAEMTHVLVAGILATIYISIQ